MTKQAIELLKSPHPQAQCLVLVSHLKVVVGATIPGMPARNAFTGSDPQNKEAKFKQDRTGTGGL